MLNDLMESVLNSMAMDNEESRFVIIEENKPDLAIPEDNLMLNIKEFTRCMHCTICSSMSIKPKICSKCNKPYCTDCINRWKQEKENICPLRCSNITYLDICGLTTSILKCIELTCENCKKYAIFTGKNIKTNFNYIEYSIHCKNCNYLKCKCTGCEEVNYYQEMMIHVKTCSALNKQCFYCKLLFPNNEYLSHEHSCPQLPITCQDCELVVLKTDFDNHKNHGTCMNEVKRKMFEYKKKVELYEKEKQENEHKYILKQNIETKQTNVFKEDPIVISKQEENISSSNMYPSHLYYIKEVEINNKSEINNSSLSNSINVDFENKLMNQSNKKNEIQNYNLHNKNFGLKNNFCENYINLFEDLEIVDPLFKLNGEKYSSNTLEALSNSESDDGISFYSTGFARFTLKEIICIESMMISCMYSISDEINNLKNVKSPVDTVNNFTMAYIYFLNSEGDKIYLHEIKKDHFKKDMLLIKINEFLQVKYILIQTKNSGYNYNAFGLKFFEVTKLSELNENSNDVYNINSTTEMDFQNENFNSESNFNYNISLNGIESENFYFKSANFNGQVVTDNSFINSIKNRNNEDPIFTNTLDLILEFNKSIKFDLLEIKGISNSDIHIYICENKTNRWIEVGGFFLNESNSKLEIYKLLCSESNQIRLVSDNMFNIIYLNLLKSPCIEKCFLTKIGNGNIKSHSINEKISSDDLEVFGKKDIEQLSGNFTNSYVLIELDSEINFNSIYLYCNFDHYNKSLSKLLFLNTEIYVSINGVNYENILTIPSFEYFPNGIFKHNLDEVANAKYLKFVSKNGWIKINKISLHTN